MPCQCEIYEVCRICNPKQHAAMNALSDKSLDEADAEDWGDCDPSCWPCETNI